MREPKYKVWDTEKKTMSYYSLSGIRKCCELMSRYIVMQYSGLKP
ncbi:hypothetical protein LCGC14_0305800 [marine sediment metagenome]|uniref:Uncharacterized protein n=1 Tax=marine sediment metagenome TaxID=412755 RepID=A0A0F9WAI9_9ZZZZ